MMEIGSKYSTFCERHIPMYKLDNLIFKRIDQFIRLPRWLNRVKYENQTGVCTDNLTTILQSNPRELLTNMSQIKHYYKSLYLDYDQLMDVIPRAMSQLFYQSKELNKSVYMI